MSVNEVLREKSEIETAYSAMRRDRLTVPDDRSKCWDERKALDFIISRGNEKSFILDVGTSKCRILESLYDKRYRNLYGCDLAPVEWRRRIYPYLFNLRFADLMRSVVGRPPIRLSVQSLEKTDYPSGEFDFITSLSVIEHGVAVERYFTEMSRLLKKGGYLITSADYWPEKIDASDVKLYDLTWNIFSRKEIEDMVAVARTFGFKLIEPIDFVCGRPAIELKGKQYTFIFFILQKDREL